MASAEADTFSVRVTQNVRTRRLINFILKLFDGKVRTVRLESEGRSITKCIKVVNVLRARLPSLHQLNEVPYCSSTAKCDGSEFQAGCKSVMIITLSQLQLDSGHYGYQPPLGSHQSNIGLGSAVDRHFEEKEKT
jgi:DNA-binding protein